MIYDVFTYNGESKMLQLHLGVLNDYVDRFIIVEANKTFTGADKPLYFFRDQRYFAKWWDKIDYYVVDQWDDSELWDLANKSPNTVGASHWKREFYIKESIQKAMVKYGIEDDDTVLIGDVDEIIDPKAIYESESPIKAKLRVYAYWLNNRSSEPFWGTLIAQYKEVKGECLNHMRSNRALYSEGNELGWHFTSMGGLEEVRRKLNDSYTPESYNTYEVQMLLPDRMKAGQDYLGRNFQFKLDEREWPDYLTANRSTFKYLCK